MPDYQVTAEFTVAYYVSTVIEAESEEEAIEQAQDLTLRDFDVDERDTTSGPDNIKAETDAPEEDPDDKDNPSTD